ncbi:protein BRUSHY, partial [Trifolium pratense]
CCLKVSIPRKCQLGRKWQLGLAGVLHIIEALAVADNNSLEELNLADNSVPTELSALQCDLPSKSCSQNQEDKIDTMKVDDNQEAFCSLNTLDEQLEVVTYAYSFPSLLMKGFI